MGGGGRWEVVGGERLWEVRGWGGGGRWEVGGEKLWEVVGGER